MKLKQILVFCILSPFISLDTFANIEKLKLDPGFAISIFANDLDQPRQMAEGKGGTIFLGQRSGEILALIDSDNNGQVDSRRVVADNLIYSTGVSIFNGKYGKLKISRVGCRKITQDYQKKF
ncbi:hypothetical protein N9Q01_02530 [Gammaproteobacteria bacterium]|nr:hypothetical protein [Gammaproteobacteria bacterium]